MTELKIETSAAVENIKKLIAKTEELKNNIKSLRSSSVSDVEAINKALAEYYASVMQVTIAKKELIELEAQARKSIQAQISAYAALSRAKTEALGKLRELILSGDKNSQAAHEAAEEYRKYTLQLKALADTVKNKTGRSFEILVNKQRLAKQSLQDLYAAGEKNGAAVDAATEDYKRYTEQISKVNENIRNLTKATEDESGSVNKSATSYDKLYKKLAAAKKAMYSARIESGNNSEAAKKATKSHAALAKQMRKVKGEAGGLSKAFKKFTPTLASVAGALGFAGIIYSMVEFVRQTIKTIRILDSLNFTIKTVFGTMFEQSQSFIFMIQLTRDFGVELVATTERWVKFRVAAKQSGLTLRDTQDIFRTMTKAGAVLGLKTDELRGIYLALEQMLSKGKVTTEELRRQLGERLPGAMGIMAASLNVTTRELDKMLKKGEVISSEVMPKFARALEASFGLAAVTNVTTFTSALGKAESAWQTFIDVVINSESRVSVFFSRVLGLTTNLLDVLTMAYGSTSALLRALVAREQERIRMLYNQNTKIKIDNARTGADKIAKIEQELADVRIAILEPASREELKLSLEKQKKLIQQQEDFYNEVDLLRRKNAKKTIEKYGGMEAADETIAQIKDFMDGAESLGILQRSLTELSITVNDQEITGNLGVVSERLANIVANINDAKLVLEKGVKVKIFDDEDEDEDSSGRKKLTMAKEYLGTIKHIIIAQNVQKREAGRLLEAEASSYQTRKEALDDIYNLSLSNAMLERGEAETRLKEALVNEKNKWIGVKTKFEEGHELYAAQVAQAYKGMREADKKYKDGMLISEATFNAKMYDIKRERIDNEYDALEYDYNLKAALAKESYDAENNIRLESLALVKSGGRKAAKINQEILDAQTDYTNSMIELQLLLLEAKMEVAESEQDYAAVERIGKAMDALSDMYKDYQVLAKSFADMEWEDVMMAFQNILNEIGSLGDAIFERRIAQIDAEIEKETEKYDRLLDLARNDEQEQKIIQRNKAKTIEELEKKKRKEQVKQAKFDKAIALNNAIINTALAIVTASANAFPLNIVMMALVGAVGALQIATIAAQPIPTFAEGGIMNKDGMALINDGGNKEYIERNGTILSTDKTNAIVELRRGDIIHKDYDTLRRKAIIMNAFTNNNNDSDNSVLTLDASGIALAVEQGLRKAKLTPTIILENDNYKRELIEW